MYWARIVELCIAGWLFFSPFIFQYPKEHGFLFLNDFTSAMFICLFSLICIVPRLNKVHFCNDLEPEECKNMKFTSFPKSCGKITPFNYSVWPMTIGTCDTSDNPYLDAIYPLLSPGP